MYLHKKDYEIRYTDVDFNDNLKLSSLLSLLEESACLSADELGFGYAELQPKNIGFILVNWYIELFRPIALGDKLSVHTWPIEPRFCTVFRDFELYVGGEKVGVATSRWCTVDLASFNMVPAKNAIGREIVYNDFRSVQFNAWNVAFFRADHICKAVQIRRKAGIFQAKNGRRILSRRGQGGGRDSYTDEGRIFPNRLTLYEVRIRFKALGKAEKHRHFASYRQHYRRLRAAENGCGGHRKIHNRKKRVAG